MANGGPEMIANFMRPILTMDDESAYKILCSTYKEFLSNINDHPCFDEFKSSIKFITLLTQVVLANELTYEERVYCNAIVYKQINTASDTMKVILLNLGLAANRKMVGTFIKCGLDRKMSTFLAVARKSSFQKKDCISRMNFIIMCTSPDLMTTKMITDIYCASANTIEDVYQLFIYSVKDNYIENNDDEWVTDSHRTISSRMDSAIFSILESIPQNELESMLEAYYIFEVKENKLDEDDVRFSFKNINPVVFPNLAAALDKVVNQRGHILP